MKGNLAVALLCVSAMFGCASAHLYPVKGPLSTQSPPPVYSVKVSGAFFSGSFEAKLTDGEVCKGHWTTVSRGSAPGSPNATSPKPAEPMKTEWDTVYGTGYFQANVLGSRLYGRGVAKGPKGTILTMEMFKDETRPDLVARNDVDTRAIKGVAKDDKGNVYKLVFN